MILKRLFKKGKLVAAIAVIAAVVVPFSVFAATSDTTAAKSIRGFFGIDASKLNDQQKQTVKDYAQKFADLQKEFIDSMVANGAITKEQGDEAKKQIDSNLQYGQSNGIIPGFGMFNGFQKRGGPGLFGLDVSKLTDAQKKDITDSIKEAAAIQKELAGKMADSGLITTDNRDAAIKSIDEMLASLDKNGLTDDFRCLMDGFGGIRFLGMAAVKQSSLTADQKSILTDYANKLANVQKNLVNKLVSDGALTKEQGDAAISRIESAASNAANGFSNGFPEKGMMKGGRFGRHGGMNGFGGSNNPAQTTPSALQAAPSSAL